MSFFGEGMTLHSQSSVISTGSQAEGAGGNLSYTIGQIGYTMNIGSSGNVLLGVQQPYEISVETGIDEFNGFNLDCKVFPNPTTEVLILEVEKYVDKNLSYLLFDIGGKLLEIKKVIGNQSIISLRNLMPTTYFLKITEGSTIVKTFKIIKN
jgi:hypothetical protein